VADEYQPPLPIEWSEPDAEALRPIDAAAVLDDDLENELNVLRTQLDQLRQHNQVKYQELTMPRPDGQRAMPDPLGVLALRLNTLLDQLLDEATRVRFDVAFEQNMSQALDDMLAEKRKADLRGLVSPPGPGLFVPGR
jgi:hypothetical protein